jgi:sugar lactone lactonase YvrE
MKTFKIVLGVAIAVLSMTVVLAQSTETIALQGNQLFPEGIITLPNNNLLVGGFGDGSIQRIDNKNSVSYFSKPGENGMVIAVGFALDKKNNRLWVANFNFKTESGNPGSNMKVFDLKTGKLLKTLPEKFIQGAFFNEVTLDEKGNVYVSDTFAPNLWTTNFEATDTKVFVTDAALLKNPSPDQPFGLNGLTITPDNKYLIASVMNRTIKGGGTLVRVNLSSKAVTTVKLKDDEATKAFSGSDGMFFHKGQLLMVNVYSQSGAIFTAKFNADYSEAGLTIRNKFQSVYDRPTASAIRNGKLYTVNSQLNHIIDDKDGKLNTPPVLPFNVVAVPLTELLK